MPPMQPAIRYAPADDGARIAYYAKGSGPSVCFVPLPPYSLLEADWSIDELRARLDAWAQMASLLRFDLRGFGLSGGAPRHFSPDRLARDIGAVLDAANVERAALVATGLSSVPALEFAARNPDASWPSS